MNVFEMYYANGQRVGFWIVRERWGFTVARVVAIGDHTSGPLRGLGRYPFFNGARDAVYVELYRWRPGGAWERITPEFDQAPHDPSLAVLRCPGTYAYEMIEAPAGIEQVAG